MDIILGPPGSGKGTQSQLLKKRNNIIHLSAGDLLRQHYPVGTEVRNQLDRGLYVSVNIVNNLLKSQIIKYNYNVIIDGYPRSVEQAIFINQFPIKNVFVLYTKDYNILLNRILNRHQCHICHNLYNAPGICCDSPLQKRNDDNIDSFKKRFTLFQETFYDVLCNLNKRVFFLDATKPIEHIYTKISELTNEI